MARPARGSIEPAAIARATLAAIGADLAAYVLLALVLVGAPTLLADSLQETTSTRLAILGGAVLQVLLTTIVVHSVLERLGGRPASVFASLGAGLRYWPLVAGLDIVAGVAVLAGLLLLVVPGIMLSLRWLVPVPAMMAERLGLGASLKRSAELTAGHRWMLFGLLVLWVVPFLVAPTLILRSMLDADQPGWATAAIDMAADMAGALTSAAGSAVIFHALKGRKEGDLSRVSVFD